MTEPPAAVTLPGSAWAFGGLCLVGEALQLLDRGPSTSDAVVVVLSVVLSALLVWWFANGVMRARSGRVIVVWVLLALNAGLQFVATMAAGVDGASGLAWLAVALSLGQVGAYAVYSRSAYFRSQEMLHGRAGVALGGILLLAVLTGAMGGLTQPVGQRDGSQTFHVGL